MKRFLMAVLLLTGAGFFLEAQQTITRTAVIDMNRIVGAMTSTQAAQAFSDKRAKVQAEINRLNEELQGLTARLAEARENNRRNQIRSLEKEVQEKTAAVQEYIKTAFAELEQDRAKLVDNALLTRIANAARLVAESEGYTIVLDRQENSAIIWYSPSVDITGKVLERLRGGGRR
jgi:outer membrane protein